MWTLKYSSQSSWTNIYTNIYCSFHNNFNIIIDVGSLDYFIMDFVEWWFLHIS